LLEFFKNIAQKKVLIIGDSMVDAYMWGKVHRMSPEAPVPVLDIHTKENRLGGAANVALNVKSLGALPILCTMIGADQDGLEFKRLLDEADLNSEGLYIEEGRKTAVKTRIINDNKHLLRIDDEHIEDLEHKDSFLSLVKDILGKHEVDVVIFEDYNKGLLTAEIIEESIQLFKSKGIPMIVDPKKKNFLEYQGVDIFKPNLKELKEGLELEFDQKDPLALSDAVKQLKDEINCAAVLLTLSEDGVFIMNNAGYYTEKAKERNIIDVSGAGDTVVSVAAIALANKLSIKDLARISNIAGGLVCEKVGVVPIDKLELKEEVEKILL